MTGKKTIPFEILDSIRGIASLYVAIAHCRGVLWVGGNEFLKMFPRETWNAWDYITFGTSMLTRLAVEFVIVFFVLSGFSIAHSLANNKTPLPFYKRRFIRIYPSYLVALIWAGIVFVATSFWHPQWYDGTMTEFAFIRTMEMNSYFETDFILGNLFYLPGRGFITPFWSLTFEVIFYLLAPFLLRRVNLYAIISFVLFLLHLLIPRLLESLHLPGILYEFVFVYNVYFAVGVSLYTYFDPVMKFAQQISKKAMLWMILLVVLVMYAVNIYFRVETVYSFMVSAILGIILIVYFLKYTVRIPWLMNVGKFSYTLYITHFATIYLYLALYWWLAKPEVPYILNYLVWIPGVGLVLLIAWIQYQLVEKKTKTILNYLRSRNKTSS